MRIDFWQYLLDRQGTPLEYAPVRVYLAGTLTEADIYIDAAFGSITTSSTVNLTTNKYGLVQFWVGDQWEVEGGYTVDQQFKVRWFNSVDSIYEEIDNLYIYTPIRPIVVTDSIAGNPTNRDKNKAISNAQGYDWDTHVDSAPYDTPHPHDIAPITLFDLDTDTNKVISNKLGYQMYQLAATSSATPLDVSAANYHSETISTWSTSGGFYYKDITHNFNNYYPAVSLAKDSNDYQLIPENIKALNGNTVRIWSTRNITMRVIVLG